MLNFSLVCFSLLAYSRYALVSTWSVSNPVSMRWFKKVFFKGAEIKINQTRIHEKNETKAGPQE